MITINLDKAKAVGHNMRRVARAEEFAPYDNIIMKQIPGNSFTEAEASRQAIRDKYEIMQEAIDSSNNVDAIKTALGL
jgi:hypothetical protein